MGEEKRSLMHTKEQERAKVAWETIKNINQEKDKQFKREYRSWALKLPTLILTNGLGQSLAFLKSKGKNDIKKVEERIYQDLQNWLFENITWGNANQNELMERIVNISSDKYRHVTIEALGFLNWLKKFADAVLPKEGE